jgi:hypothetical protein
MVAAHICPHCLKPIPAALLTAYTDNLECPHCQTLLEVSTPSRMPAIWIALAAAWLVWYLTHSAAGTSPDTIDWVLPEVYAILTFGIVAPLVLMFTAVPVLLPVVPASIVSGTTIASGHGAGHISGHDSSHAAGHGAHH